MIFGKNFLPYLSKCCGLFYLFHMHCLLTMRAESLSIWWCVQPELYPWGHHCVSQWTRIKDCLSSRQMDRQARQNFSCWCSHLQQRQGGSQCLMVASISLQTCTLSQQKIHLLVSYRMLLLPYFTCIPGVQLTCLSRPTLKHKK